MIDLVAIWTDARTGLGIEDIEIKHNITRASAKRIVWAAHGKGSWRHLMPRRERGVAYGQERPAYEGWEAVSLAPVPAGRG